MDQASVIADNQRELARLRDLLASLTDEQFSISLGGGWTVGAALGHLAFWDQRAVVLLTRWEEEGVGPSGSDSDALNRACLPLWLALPGRTAADLALKAAETVNKKIEALPPHIFSWAANQADSPITINRSLHRAEHIEQIQQVIKIQ